jgi:hypothetical protein
MRFTSSARKSLALFLSVILFRNAGGIPAVLAESPVEPCILLKVSASSIPPDVAKGKLGAMETLLEEGLLVRFLPLTSTGDGESQAGEPFPAADDQSLEKIAESLGSAIRHMERMDTKAATERLSEAENIARSFRFGETTRPYLAEIFLRRGLLSLWEGEAGIAEEMLARSRVLRPGFIPDPAMFSPLFLEAWMRSGERPPPRAEILVNSLPPGAKIYLDGEEAGMTPGRVPVSRSGPVTIRVLAEGYLPGERTGQWLPGDSEAMDFPLARDPNAALLDILSSSPDGKEAGPLLSRMILETGARRAALLLLEEGDKGMVLRVSSLAQGEDAPVVLGMVEWQGGDEGIAQVVESTVKMLIGAGWPARSDTDTEGSPWYRKWWVWTLLGVAAAGVAVGLGGSGGGGSSESSTGTIGVNF